tara:strand:- start:873 stop:1532 length:660 start_codon:yes stop_codon:yes gene_type:complete
MANEITTYKELVSGKRNIKLELRTWNTLKNLKKPNETFNDVVLSLLKERTMSIGGKNVKALKYSRKTLFLESSYLTNNGDYADIGIEFEYNDVKEEHANFNLDLKIKKVFCGKKIMNPSEFFGVDNLRKHFHLVYLNLYLKCVVLALEKEFKVNTRMRTDNDFENIVRWRRIYYDHSLSEDSFINDIEEPLRLSEEKPPQKIIEKIKKSTSNKIWNIIK